ncbi:MAG: GNAT family N-acetyltransferase [Campylobacteraceae bacterium]
MNFIYEKDRIYAKDENEEVVAEITFPLIDENTVNINHTFVSPKLRGGGVASKLMLECCEVLKKEGKKAVATCSYADIWFKRNSEYTYILKN